jgi:PAS domain S-box-containing protein
LAEQKERLRRQEAEAQIRELNLMLNQAHDAIVIVDLEGKIRYWSEGSERLFGWQAPEVMGLTVAELFRAELLPALYAASAATARDGSWEGELELNNRKGEAVIVATRRSLVRDGSGTAKAFLSINTDITQRKQMEEHLQRVRRLENVGLIASAVAHDLNNILAPIALGVPMLREQTTDPEALNLLGMLEQSAVRGTELVRNMLAFVNHGGPALEATQLDPLVAEIRAVIEQTFPRAIDLDVECPAVLPPVALNPTQLHQILMNLCVNARDAMPAGGRLSLRLQRRTIGVLEVKLKPGEYVQIEIEDTGTGIPPHVLERMWEAFYSTKQSGRGTGLGLSTVKGIVENCGGAIEVRTTVGQGTNFRLYLPVAPERALAATAAGEAQAPPGHGETILVVDDEAAVRLVVSTVLNEAGYRVILAANGSQALDIYAHRAKDIALVVTDNIMPGIDGPRLARLLKGMDPALRIVAVSGAQGAGVAQFDAGTFQKYLSKPYRARELLAAVAQVLQGAPPRDLAT